MLIPAFHLQLKNPIQPRLATVGSYDSKHPSLTCATTGGKVFIHSPHERDEDSMHSIRFLNINKKISAITSGRISHLKGDILIVGTQNNLLAYDVENNSDIFYKDVPDGINTLLIANLWGDVNPIIFVGGNCSIQGFDHEGNEVFWTVTGDNVSCFTSCDINKDGKQELLVGSDDYEIRAFHHEDVVFEVTESDKIVDLCGIKPEWFGYALQNGTVGVYKGKTRIWRVKSMNIPICISCYDIDGDGENEIIIGWNNGKVEIRRHENGQLIFKDHFSSSIASIVKADYRMDGQEEVICCSIDGEIKGYLTAHSDSVKKELLSLNTDEELVTKLLGEKYNLTTELKNMEKNTKQNKTGSSFDSIPSDTNLLLEFKHNLSKQCLDIHISTNNQTVIKNIILLDYDSGILQEGESLYFCPSNIGTNVRIPITPVKNVSAELLVKVLISTRGNSTFSHVIEKKKLLPKFAMFCPVEKVPNEAKSYVKMNLPERPQRVISWLKENFLCSYLPPSCSMNSESLNIDFINIRNNNHLQFVINGNELLIKTNEMELAGDLLQELSQSLQIKELETIAEFPDQIESFREVLEKVDEYNSTRLQLTADIADESNVVKSLVIRAEDSRILSNMKLMRKAYNQLYMLNNQLIREYKKRSNNHQELLSLLKEVNTMIQYASKLRIGEAKVKVVAECRKAIKENNIPMLFHILRYGHVASSTAKKQQIIK